MTSISNSFKEFFSPTCILVLVLVFLWVLFIWGFYISYRQYKFCKKHVTVPKELDGIMDQTTFEKARLYSIEKALYNFVHGTWSHLLTNIILIFFLIAYGWNLTGNILKHFFTNVPEIGQSVAFLFFTSIFFSIIDLPWSLYYEFVLEEKHGFNKYTLKFYLVDKLKKTIIFQSILLPIMALAIYIIKIGGNYFFLYLWAFCSIVCVIFLTIYHDYIAPLFDKYIRLPDSHLKDSIKQLASKIQYPLKDIFIVEGSKRSSHSNAYLFGLFKNKKIVLFDTLIDKSVLDVSKYFVKKTNETNETKDKENQEAKEETELLEEGPTEEKKEVEKCNENEILAVLSHEFGHWKLNHIVKYLIISEINMLFILGVFGILYQNEVIYQSFGFYTEKPIIIGLTIIFEYIFLPYNEIINFLLTCLSRRFEFQADNYAKKLGKGEDLKKALIKLNKNNLSFPIYDWLYSACNHSHPPLLERIAAIGKSE